MKGGEGAGKVSRRGGGGGRKARENEEKDLYTAKELCFQGFKGSEKENWRNVRVEYVDHRNVFMGRGDSV